MSIPSVDVSQGIATISFNRPDALNSITVEDYDTLGELLREVDKRQDVVVTVLQGRGAWFSAGTDVKSRKKPPRATTRSEFLHRISTGVTDVSKALYSHSKILVAVVNGPVLGIAAAFIGHFDFIYCTPNAWLSAPFTYLALIAEAGCSVTFPRRMGLSRANDVLIFGKKLHAKELLECGFVNQIFDVTTPEALHTAVRTHLLTQLDGLDPVAVLTTKELIQYGLNEQNNMDGLNLRDSYAQAERFATGLPGERFAKIARKEIKHRL